MAARLADTASEPAMGLPHIFAFVTLTLVISWGIPGAFLLASRAGDGVSFNLAMYSPLYYVGVWGPALAAIAVIGWAHGVRGVKAFLRRMLDWRFAGRWWAFALFVIPLLYLVAAAGHGLVTGIPGFVPRWEFSLLAFLGMVIARATAGPVEELGWRGFAQPMLQRYMRPWATILVIAGLHATWHFPVFFVGQFAHFGTELPLALALLRFSVQILAITVIFAIAYNASGGSLTLAFLLHLMLNLAYPWKVDADLMTSQTVFLAGAALIMAMMTGRRWLREEHASTAVVPGLDERPPPGRSGQS
jgi:uncharacterized protein